MTYWPLELLFPNTFLYVAQTKLAQSDFRERKEFKTLAETHDKSKVNAQIQYQFKRKVLEYGTVQGLRKMSMDE